jgi:hypothetical protein
MAAPHFPIFAYVFEGDREFLSFPTGKFALLIARSNAAARATMSAEESYS